MIVRLLFLAIATYGSAYFLFARRRQDFSTVAFFASCLYFLPGFFGYTGYPAPPGYEERMIMVALESTSYVVMSLVLLAIFVSAVVADFSFMRGTLVPESKRFVSLSWSLLAIASAALLLTLWSKGANLFSPQKELAMESEGGRWHTLWIVASLLLAVEGYRRGRKWFMIIAFVFLMFDMYVGFRVTFACAFVGVSVMVMQKWGVRRLASKWKFGTVILAGVALVLAYKHVYRSVKAGAWERLSEWVVTAEFADQVIFRSEPFVTQTILNEVLRLNYRVPIENLLVVFNNLLLFPQELGIVVVPFNRQFQSVAFPYVEGGMGSNVWAEIWASGGWLFLCLFIAGYVLVLQVGNFLMLRTNGAGTTLVVAMMSYWSFYIHRNSIGFQITLERRVIVVWLVAVLAALVLEFILKRTRRFRVHVVIAAGQGAR